MCCHHILGKKSEKSSMNWTLKFFFILNLCQFLNLSSNVLFQNIVFSDFFEGFLIKDNIGQRTIFGRFNLVCAAMPGKSFEVIATSSSMQLISA